MSQKDDYQRLASQFVDIWQKNTAAMMNDSEFIRAFLQMVQNPAYGNTTTQATTGTSTAPDIGNAALTGIKNRLTTIEERLESLERTLARLVSADTHKAPKSVDGFAKRHSSRKSSRSRSKKKNH